MTTITIPAEIEHSLLEAARQRGATPEILALDGLRQLFGPAPKCEEAKGETLFDFLNGYIGTIAGSQETLSERCGEHFADILTEKQRREQS